MDSGQILSWVPRKWSWHIFQGLKKGQGHLISHQAQSGASKYPDLLPAWVPPPNTQSGASIYPDVFPAHVPPACMQSCTSGTDGSNKQRTNRNSVLTTDRTLSLQSVLFLFGLTLLPWVLSEVKSLTLIGRYLFIMGSINHQLTGIIQLKY